MNVDLTPANEAFIQQRIAAGRFATVEEAVNEALLLLERLEKGVPKVEPGRKSLAQLFRESPFRGIDLEFTRDPEPMRSVDL